MAQTLNEFLAEARDELVQFENKWVAENARDKEAFPLEMPDGSEGLWQEMLLIYRQTEGV